MSEIDPAPQPGAEKLAEPMRSRWSVSVFDATHELSGDEIDLLLTAAQWAPSSGNMQPWRFAVLPRGRAGHEKLLPTLSRGNSGWVPRASAVFLTVAELGDDGDATVPVYVTGQAAAHLTLQAHAMGLHAHQFVGFDHDAAAAAFGVPETHRLVAGIAVGRHGDPSEVPERDAEREQRPRTRKPLEEITFGASWSEPR